jgi:hypothetical protein
MRALGEHVPQHHTEDVPIAPDGAARPEAEAGFQVFAEACLVPGDPPPPVPDAADAGAFDPAHFRPRWWPAPRGES